MRNFWLMAKHEYRKMVGKRSFLLGTLGIPLLIIVVTGLGIFITLRGEDRRPLGYVDQAGVLAPQVQLEDGVEIRPYPTTPAAQSALENGDIQAYYVLPADYLDNREVSLYYWEETPSEGVRDSFNEYVRVNLAADQPEAIRALLVDGPDLTLRSLEGTRELSSSNPLNFIVPLVAAFLFFFVVMGSAGYLLQVVTDEKENRTMEVMVTSITPLQLIGGKALGLMAVSLTQMLIWLVVAVGAILVGAQYIPLLQTLTIPWTFLLIVALFFLPSYALIAGMMTAIGGAVTELRQGQQIAGLLNLLFVFPFFFTVLIFGQPDSPILVALTLFPTTSFITVAMRWAVNVVPMWQLISSWLILVATAVFSVYVSSRIFRAGMLRYGQSLKLSGIVAAVRNR
ncbi:MAG: ABC transporter permease [Anaerolineales bacterium]|nr:ABC transporter permease [Anaerolineales bacterium]